MPGSISWAYFISLFTWGKFPAEKKDKSFFFDDMGPETKSSLFNCVADWGPRDSSVLWVPSATMVLGRLSVSNLGEGSRCKNPGVK